MMEEYFETRDQLQAVILITDLRHRPTKDDIQMYEYLKYLQLPVIIVATKHDKVKRNNQKKYLQRTIDTLLLHPDDPVVPFSAVTGTGKEKLWGILEKSYIF